MPGPRGGRRGSDPAPVRGPAPRAPLQVYALPTVIGRGRGDVEELRSAAEALARDGWPVRWAGNGRSAAVRRTARKALTITSQFGVGASPARPGPFGRAGRWAPFVERIERAFGRRNVLHLSLEEFARNLPASAQEAERWREGGRSTDWLRRRRRSRRWDRDVRTMRRLVRRYRALDRSNLLVVFPTFEGSRAFRRDFPGAIEVGPIYPAIPARPSARARRRDAAWVWYASPSTSAVLLPGIAEGVRRARRRVALTVRADGPFPTAPSEGGLELRRRRPRSRERWLRTFRDADLRIVTGSRTMLEALVVGGPFLYFNGVAGRGPARRAHRREKLRSLLTAWARMGVDPALRRDLVDVAAGRRVAAVVARAVSDPRWAGRFPRRLPRPLVGPGRQDGAAYLADVARRWAASSRGASSFVAAERRPVRGVERLSTAPA